MNNKSIVLTIAVLGGTGKEGKGLAYRWAKAGYHILIGSRTIKKAQAAAQEISELLGGEACLEGFENLEAAQKADIVALTVPYSAHRSTLEGIKHTLPGKILLDVTVPLLPPEVTTVHVPPAGSAAQEAREILGDNAEIATAFQNISYERLMHEGTGECDVLVCGTSIEARHEILKLVEAAGFIGWDAGPLENAVVVEGLTPILIGINKKYGVTNAGIKITGAKRS